VSVEEALFALAGLSVVTGSRGVVDAHPLPGEGPAVREVDERDGQPFQRDAGVAGVLVGPRRQISGEREAARGADGPRTAERRGRRRGRPLGERCDDGRALGHGDCRHDTLSFAEVESSTGASVS
jgi:hypothetical protein